MPPSVIAVALHWLTLLPVLLHVGMMLSPAAAYSVTLQPHSLSAGSNKARPGIPLLRLMSVKDSDRSLQLFENWLWTSGARFPKIALEDYGADVRGLRVTADIRQDETIVQVPLRCMVTLEMAKKTEVGKAILACPSCSKSPSLIHNLLAVFLLTDRRRRTTGPSGPQQGFNFKPYYELLPTLASFNNMPVLWSPDELQYLNGSFLLNLIADEKAAIESDYEAICQAAPTFPRHFATISDFRWARLCVGSRTFGVEINEHRSTVMVPFADMLNHDHPPKASWDYSNDLKSFVVRSTTNIRRGTQVYCSYGLKSNHVLLLHYGFSVERNIAPDWSDPNEVSLQVVIDPSDALYHLKRSIWLRFAPLPYKGLFKLSSKPVYVSATTNMYTQLLLSMLRLAEANQTELVTYLQLPEIRHMQRDLRQCKKVYAALSKNPSSVRDTIPPACSDDTNAAASGAKEALNLFQKGRVVSMISVENELRAMKHLWALCEKSIAGYPTTLEEDIAQLATLPLYSNRRNAALQVKGEKEVLRFFREYAVIATVLLELISTEQSVAIDRMLSIVRTERHPMIYRLLESNILNCL